MLRPTTTQPLPDSASILVAGGGRQGCRAPPHLSPSPIRRSFWWQAGAGGRTRRPWEGSGHPASWRAGCKSPHCGSTATPGRPPFYSCGGLGPRCCWAVLCEIVKITQAFIGSGITVQVSAWEEDCSAGAGSRASDSSGQEQVGRWRRVPLGLRGAMGGRAGGLSGVGLGMGSGGAATRGGARGGAHRLHLTRGDRAHHLQAKGDKQGRASWRGKGRRLSECGAHHLAAGHHTVPSLSKPSAPAGGSGRRARWPSGWRSRPGGCWQNGCLPSQRRDARCRSAWCSPGSQQCRRVCRPSTPSNGCLHGHMAGRGSQLCELSGIEQGEDDGQRCTRPVR